MRDECFEEDVDFASHGWLIKKGLKLTLWVSVARCFRLTLTTVLTLSTDDRLRRHRLPLRVQHWGSSKNQF